MDTGFSEARRISKPLVCYMPNRLSMSIEIAIPLEHSIECRPMAKRKNPAAVTLGRRGGKKSAQGRMQKLTPEQRSEIARNAARKRWEQESEK